MRRGAGSFPKKCCLEPRQCHTGSSLVPNQSVASAEPRGKHVLDCRTGSEFGTNTKTGEHHGQEAMRPRADRPWFSAIYGTIFDV